MKNRMIGVILSFLLCWNMMMVMEMKVMAQMPDTSQFVEHVLEKGASAADNPLKGFVPYDEMTTGKTTDFPHSMEWFYISVKDVQTDLNTFDWTALEVRLDAVAARGHQAVFRLYYDYPGIESGVPQFLIDDGLLMRPYDEPDNLGGGGLAPDYNDETFRESMLNLIAAFGETYDGDSRVGYITLGLLGFWGEWHTWPYDEDTSDDKENWSIHTEVFEEVLKAYDEAFDVTELCVREPKWGIDYTNLDIGFHDDSFAFATVSEEAGGQNWSFMSKVYSFDLGDRWMSNCVGGEVYPPTQKQIFEDEHWISESGQSFEKSLEQTHATWLINEEIKNYTGDELEAARLATVQLGYDFQVSKALYKEVLIDSELVVGVEIMNQGTAPFYYSHEIWPVEIGVFRGGQLISRWVTDWDLNSIPADGSSVSFESKEPFVGDAGMYMLAMKVIPPLENGNVLKFANAGQGEDGWLELGSFKVGAEALEDIKEGSADTADMDTDTKESDSAVSRDWKQGILILIAGMIVFVAAGAFWYTRKSVKTK